MGGGNRLSYKRTPIRLSADFPAATLQAGRVWHNILNVLKGKNLQPRILYTARSSFRIGERNTSQISKN